MTSGIPTPTIGAATTTSSVTTSSTSTTAFDLDQFLTGKLGGVFLESEDTVGVVVLVPACAESDVDVMLGSLPELEGYTHVSPDVVASAADRFATTESGAITKAAMLSTARLSGSHVTHP